MRDPGLAEDERFFHTNHTSPVDETGWRVFYTKAGWHGHFIPEQLFYTMLRAYVEHDSPGKFPSPQEYYNRPTVQREVDLGSYYDWEVSEENHGL